MRQIAAAIALAGGLGPWWARAADSPVGKWKTVDDKTGKTLSEVEIYDQGGKLFGKIVGLTEPNDAQGKPKTCTKCQGGDKDQPIVGLVIVRDLAASGDKFKGGTILDPEDGKVYKAEIWVEDGKLRCAATSACSTRRRRGSRQHEPPAAAPEEGRGHDQARVDGADAGGADARGGRGGGGARPDPGGRRGPERPRALREGGSVGGGDSGPPPGRERARRDPPLPYGPRPT